MFKTSESVSAKRTAVNFTVIAWVVTIVAKVTGWTINITEADMWWIAPVAGAVLGFAYRLSRFLTTKWPVIGWLLFGSGQEPAGMKKIGE